MLYVAQLNVAISQDKPFEIAKTDLPAAQSVIYAVLDGLHNVAHMLAAILPETCSEILRRLGSPQLPLTLAELRPLSLAAGLELQEGPPLFPKYEFKVEVEVPAAPQVLHATSPAADAPAGLPAIGIDHFGATELKIGQVLHAEPVPKSTKLLRLQIDLGEAQPRQILSGIAESFTPDQLVGQQVLVLANLAPRKMMGMESRGMVLVAEDAEGKRVLVQPQRAVPAGVQVR
jgi:methionyl-tRNA synthetase